MNFTITLNNVNEADVSKVGVRGINLAKIHQAKYPVLPTFIVPRLFYEEFLTENGIESKLNSLTRDYWSGKRSSKEIYEEIRSLFYKNNLSEEYVLQLKEAYTALSVRTNAGNAEDLLKNEEPLVNIIVSPNYNMSTESLNGVFLNIKGFNNFLSAIRSAWASLFRPKNLEYRKKYGIKTFHTGLIVQRSLNVDATIEARTRPDLGDYGMIIKANKGFPDILNCFSADNFSVSKEFLKIEEVDIRRQEYILEKTDKSGVLKRRPLGNIGSEQKIPDDKVIESARIVKRFKVLFNDDFVVRMILKRNDLFVLFADVLAWEKKETEPKQRFDEVYASDKEEDNDISEDVVPEETESESDEFVVNGSDESDQGLQEAYFEEEKTEISEPNNENSNLEAQVEESEEPDISKTGAAESSIGGGNEFYKELVREIEEEIDQKIYALYRDKFGDEPLSSEDGLLRLSQDSDIHYIESVKKLKELKKQMMNGFKPDLESFNDITEEAKKFL